MIVSQSGFVTSLPRRLRGWAWVVALALAGPALGEPAAPAVDLQGLARRNDVAGVSAFLENHGAAAVTQADANGVTALHVAAALNHHKLAGFLLARGAARDARTAGGFTPLHWAAARDATAAATLLLEAGADVNVETPAGITPLHWAAGNNATNMVKLLIAREGRLDTATENGFTPLHWAVLQGATESAFILAYQAVTQQMEGADPAREAPGLDLQRIVEEEARLPAPEPETAEDLEPDFSVRPTEGSHLMIPLGRGQNLEFVWIAALKLWCGKYEVTNAQFRRFDPKHNSLFRGGLSLNEEDQPAVYVSWPRARAMAVWLTRHFEFRLPRDCEVRLPSENEWTVMACVGDDRVYPWGNEWPPAYGNYADETMRAAFGTAGMDGYLDGFAVTCPVARSGENEWRVFGLAGNVAEWCEDWHDPERRYKARRGAAWDYADRTALRIDTRGFERPATADDTIGFRLVVAPRNPRAPE
jgi:hypothetical protein